MDWPLRSPDLIRIEPAWDVLVAKSLTVSDSTQTDENITKLVCKPLKILQPASPLSKKYISVSIPTISTSSTTEAHLLASTSTISQSQKPIPKFNPNGPSYLADQVIVKKSRKQLLPKYNETSTPRLQFSKSNTPIQVAAIVAQNFTARKKP
ncbi:hypothetical protein TNCV_4567611 [Trichonephila clavipes]|nr:hypothetical protein TNCV_4567611 [Trichonephila clavipes]